MFLNTLQLWDFLVIIPLVSAQVPNMSHLKGLRAVIKIIMISFHLSCLQGISGITTTINILRVTPGVSSLFLGQTS